MNSVALSTIIITRNEEANLERCLLSLQDLAGEVVVVDSDSTDQTTAIASRLRARVIEHPFEGFVAQKNFALSQCRNQLVLAMDADEELSPELKSELAELLPRCDTLRATKGITGWAMPRRVRYLGRWIRHGDWNPDYVTRLFYRDASRYCGGAVHERLETSGRVERLQGLLWHYSFRDVADHWARMRRYSTLWAQSQAADGAAARLLDAPLHAGFRFLRALLLKQGWRDGWRGVLIAVISAAEVFAKYRKLRALNHRPPGDNA